MIIIIIIIIIVIIILIIISLEHTYKISNCWIRAIFSKNHSILATQTLKNQN